MFNKDLKDFKEISSKEVETIIGPHIKVKGNFHGQGNIIIEGMIEGDVKTTNFILVGTKAVITANIEAKDAKIGGEIKGDIKIAGYLEINSTAKVFGNIEANEISIERGAILNGNCVMLKNTSSKQKETSE
jgi:cytoskeletal protein CcmA (bactofilin family)